MGDAGNGSGKGIVGDMGSFHMEVAVEPRLTVSPISCSRDHCPTVSWFVIPVTIEVA
jgi:hypothetical protein